MTWMERAGTATRWRGGGKTHGREKKTAAATRWWRPRGGGKTRGGAEAVWSSGKGANGCFSDC